VAGLAGSVFGLLGLAVVLGLIVSPDRCAIVPNDVKTVMPDESATMLDSGKPHAHTSVAMTMNTRYSLSQNRHHLAEISPSLIPLSKLGPSNV
jgi:hypothetical protein